MTYQQALGFGDSPGDWGHSAEYDSRAAAHVFVHLKHDRRGHNRVGPSFSIQHFVIRAARSRARRGKFDRRQHFIVAERILARRVLLRQNKEVGRWNRSLALRSHDAELRV